MSQKVKSLLSLVRAITPPVIYTSASRLYYKLQSLAVRGQQREAEWYDQVFRKSRSYKMDYSETRYYAMWSVIVDRMISKGVRMAVDLGCGPGQFALLAQDRGLENYLGVDFSKAQISWATDQCPEFDFVVGDLFDFDFGRIPVDAAIVCTEVLEHVDRDLAIVERLPPERLVFISVPNFPAEGHVRHFDDAGSVSARYAKYFDAWTVTSFRSPRSKANVLFLGMGVRNTLLDE